MLFFGYIEDYSIATALTLMFFYLVPGQVVVATALVALVFVVLAVVLTERGHREPLVANTAGEGPTPAVEEAIETPATATVNPAEPIPEIPVAAETPPDRETPLRVASSEPLRERSAAVPPSAPVERGPAGMPAGRSPGGRRPPPRPRRSRSRGRFVPSASPSNPQPSRTGSIRWFCRSMTWSVAQCMQRAWVRPCSTRKSMSRAPHAPQM